MAGERVLVLEDDRLLATVLAERFGREGWEVAVAGTLAEARAALDGTDPDVALCDLKLPDGTSLELVREFHERGGVVFVMMTAHATVGTAVEALKLGARDYLEKPFSLDRAVATLRQALELTALRREVAAQRDRSSLDGTTVIGESPAMRSVFALVRRLASTDAATVLIEGESGSGKGAIAQAIHRLSRRSGGPFVNVTCAALPETLMESELFGHEKGAFTDARTAKRGLVEMAAGGSLFLDEIGELTPGVQAKLLRFIEEKTFRRLGGTRDLIVDVRIMTATNRDLQVEAEAGRFRPDLYYRLRVIPITLPPLRERPEDIPLLARQFLSHFAGEFAKRIRAIAPEAQALLCAYRWPGNVRELRNVMERAVLLADGDEVGVAELPPEVTRRSAPGTAVSGGAPAARTAPESLPEVERRLLAEALEGNGGNQSRAAAQLGISRHQLRTRMRRYGLLALVLAAFTTPLRAQGAGRGVSEAERRESASCGLCHGDVEVLRRSAPAGWHPDSLLVTPADLAGTAHEAVPCIRCHPQRGTLPHPAEPRSAVPCGTCHAEADSLWKAGPHGGRRGQPEAPCASCHGTHRVRRVADLRRDEGLRELSAQCVTCHTDRALPPGDVHRDKVNCASCHGDHMLQSVRDPATRGIPIGIARRCASCHEDVAAQAWEDVHGRAAQAMAAGLRPMDGDTAATCVACHGGHGMSPAHQEQREAHLVESCTACHEEAGESYAESYHGRATRIGYERAARCADCHTGHAVLPSSDSLSTTAPQRLGATCGQCHQSAARETFLHYRVHSRPGHPSEGPIIYGAWLFMNVLLFSVFTVFGLHTLFWLKRLLELRWAERQRYRAAGERPPRRKRPLDSAAAGTGPWVWRFKLTHRIIHGVSVVSFFVLILTGLPLRFSCALWASDMMRLMGGPHTAAIAHRVAGGITVAYFLAHVVHMLIVVWRTKDRKSLFWGTDSMIPQPRDARDFVQMWKWFFGRAEFPRFPRYGYNEKFHYFGAFWGIVLLGGSGLIRWFPGFFTGILPGWAFNVAVILHSEEAVLAAGFMFIIHFFNVHLRPGKFPMDGTMFTGRLRIDELAHDHAETAARIGDLTGVPVSQRAIPDLPAPPPPRWVTIAAAVMGLGALAVGLVIVGMVLWVQAC